MLYTLAVVFVSLTLFSHLLTILTVLFFRYRLAKMPAEPKIPGLTAPVDYHPDFEPSDAAVRRAFPSAVRDWQSNTPTLREISMMWFVNTITDKPGWESKVFDEHIIAKWRAEVDVFASRGKEEASRLDSEWRGENPPDPFHSQWRQPPVARGFSEAMFDYCINELRDKAEVYKKSGVVSVLDGAATVLKSDTAVSDTLLTDLVAAAAKLETDERSSPEGPDWHPGSDEQVLDLVHPSLWPLVYGVSRALRDRELELDACLAAYAAGSTIPPPQLTTTKDNLGRLTSDKFQWLPAEVDVAADGSAKFKSYINNLHPIVYKDLYAVLERLVASAMPMLDACYSRVMTWQALTENKDWHNDADLEYSRNRIVCFSSGRQCTVPNLCDRHCAADNRPRDEDDGGPGDDWDADQRWFERTHPVAQPEPREYDFKGVKEYRTYGPWLQPPRVQDSFGPTPSSPLLPSEQRFQVIVKLANIHLTPDKPSYAGGSWHIEGQLNERIVATALFYYDCENITESKLGFQTVTDAEGYSEGEFEYEQSDHEPFRQLYGCSPGLGEDSKILQLGHVVTRQGRLLVFPNVFRHQVSPFELADMTRPGHRKIVALFLVDPAVKIISTAQVPPQQRHWGQLESKKVEHSLPPEIMELVYADLECPFDLATAKTYRAQLVEERKGLDVEVDKALKLEDWCFCEH